MNLFKVPLESSKASQRLAFLEKAKANQLPTLHIPRLQPKALQRLKLRSLSLQ